MKSNLYAIIDIETTGGRASDSKITEIAIVLHDGEKIIDTWESLINPETYIPPFIVNLTGITQEMVKDAPKFYEVAKKIVEMTENAIFVAHNVRFDYSFIKEEFKKLGYTYTRKQLCTIKLSRRTFPGLRSYGLSNLIRSLNLKNKNRHRAMGDTMTTVELFEKILAHQENNHQINDLVNLGVKEALLPQNISMETLHNLPEACGVYFFNNPNGYPVYIGKSINIKKRVMSHFSKITQKAAKLQQAVFDISYELTGSELIALLHESQLIKSLNPKINRAQRTKNFPIMIHTYYNEEGYICFETAPNSRTNKKSKHIVTSFPSATRAKGKLIQIQKKYELCPSLCHTDIGNKPCFNYHIQLCKGACIGEESATEYNDRATLALDAINTVFTENFIILDKGRTEFENSLVIVENGSCLGFGYIDKDEVINEAEDMKNFIKSYPSYPETARIIQNYVEKNFGKLKIIKF